MNGTYLVIGIFIFLILMFVVGYSRGFIRIAFSILAMIISVFLVNLLEPVVVNAIEKTDVYQSIYKSVENSVNGTIVEKMTGKEKEAYSNQQINEFLNTKLDQQQMQKLYNSIQLPNMVKQQIEKVQNTQAKSGTVSLLSSQLAAAITNMVLHVVVFIVLFVIINAILRLIISLLDIVSRLPIINMINRAGGGVLGLAEGVLILWVAFLIVDLVASSGQNAALLQTIKNNQILNWIYEKNLLTSLLKSMMH